MYMMGQKRTHSASGVPRILEWEWSRSYRLRGGGTWGGGIPSLLGGIPSPSPLREGHGEGAVPIF